MTVRTTAQMMLRVKLWAEAEIVAKEPVEEVMTETIMAACINGLMLISKANFIT